MLDFTGLLYKLIEIFFLLCVGYIGRAVGLFSDASNRVFSAYTVKIGCPAILLAALMNTELYLTPGKLFYYIAVACVWQLLMLALALLFSRFFAKKGSERGSFAFMLTFGNIGFFGLPVIKPLFGADGLFVAALFNVPFNFLAYSFGILMIQGGRKEGQKLWKMLLTPAVITATLVPFLYLLRLKYPAPLVNVVSTLGDMTLPMLMFTVGSTLRTMKLSEMVSNWKVDITVALKLLIFPLLISPLLRLALKGDTLMLGVSTLLACMPVAGASTALNILYGSHEKESGAAVFLSTILSLGTIPLMTWLLLM